MKKTRTAAIAALAITLAMTGCAGTEAPAPGPDPADEPTTHDSLEALVEAAQAEGAVRVYSTLPERDQEILANGFTEKYGIKVDSLRLGGTTLPARFEAEVDAGSPSGEVLLATTLEFLLAETESGSLVPFDETGVKDMLDGLPEAAILEDYAGVPIFQVLSTGFIYNTDLVTADDIPTSWNDLVTGDFAGEYCAVAPDTSESLMIFMDGFREAEGDEVLAKFGENVGLWYPSVIPMNEAVASGECAIGVNSAQFFVDSMQSKDAPVEFAVAPTAVYPTIGAAVATEAEHPNAARLFMHFVLSAEGSGLVNDPAAGSFSAMDADSYPADFSVLPPEKHQAVLDSTSEVLGILGY